MNSELIKTGELLFHISKFCYVDPCLESEVLLIQQFNFHERYNKQLITVVVYYPRLSPVAKLLFVFYIIVQVTFLVAQGFSCFVWRLPVYYVYLFSFVYCPSSALWDSYLITVWLKNYLVTVKLGWIINRDKFFNYNR